MAPFTDRQYSRVIRGGGDFPDKSLFEVLPWRIRELIADKPRRVTCDDAHPVLVCTDACGEGHLGLSRVIDGKVVVAHCHVPQRMQTLGIAELGLDGSISGLTMAAEFSPRRNVLLRRDNQGPAESLPAGIHGRFIAGAWHRFFGRLRRAHRSACRLNSCVLVQITQTTHRWCVWAWGEEV